MASDATNPLAQSPDNRQYVFGIDLRIAAFWLDHDMRQPNVKQAVEPSEKPRLDPGFRSVTVLQIPGDDQMHRASAQSTVPFPHARDRDGSSFG